MNLDQIKLFMDVYKAGSFAAVAKEHNIAPSSVSRAVATLEEQLNARLFQRTTRSLAPTQLGEHYFHRIEALIEELELARQEVFSQSADPFGTLKVTASTSFGQMLLAPLLKGFCNLYPRVNIDFVLADTQSNIIEEQFDLAIRHGGLRDSNLIAKKLLDVRYLLVAHKHYLAKSNPIKHPNDINNHALISFGYRKFNHVWTFRNGKHTDSIAIKPIVTTTTAAAIKACVCNEMGLGLLPDWSIKEELESEQLVNLFPNIHISGTDFESSIWLVYPSRRFIPAKTTAFIEYLQQCI